jgi:hypothetical protein
MIIIKKVGLCHYNISKVVLKSDLFSDFILIRIGRRRGRGQGFSCRAELIIRQGNISLNYVGISINLGVSPRSSLTHAHVFKLQPFFWGQIYYPPTQ